MFLYVSERLKLNRDTGETVRQLRGVAALQDNADGVAHVQAQPAEATPAKSKTALVRTKPHRRNAREAAGMHFNNLAQIPTQHHARRHREICLSSIRQLAVPKITAQLKTAIQMSAAEVRHGDIAGEDSADPGAISALDSNQFRPGLIRFRGKAVESSKKRDGEGRQKYDGSFHRFRFCQFVTQR